MANTRSPLAPAAFPALPAIDGVRLGTSACGIRYRQRSDLMLALFDPGTTVAGVLTRSLTASAAVHWCRAALAGGVARALVVNSGNANAFTGGAGDRAMRRTVATTARLAGCAEAEVFVSSTGVIGEPLPVDKIERALPALAATLSPDAWPQAAEAITTTDTFAKGALRHCEIDGRPIKLVGIAKGSGMIAPDMATMLSYIATDATLPAELMQRLLAAAVDKSFNAITVDSDTSTSDTVLLFATGKVATPDFAGLGDRRLAGFRRALDELCRDLAQQIVRDGEGASKFVTIHVSGAASRRAAKRIAMSIANSPLVKTAIAGGDPNWGRIVMAVGKAGEKAERDALRIVIGGFAITEGGTARADYDEGPVAEYMQGDEIEIAVDVGVGRGRATVWTCDLTHGYIEINADYRS
jgi:glutamate N-acetyltransferase/amino-acid N-acetyltransferase